MISKAHIKHIHEDAHMHTPKCKDWFLAVLPKRDGWNQRVLKKIKDSWAQLSSHRELKAGMAQGVQERCAGNV